MKDNTKFSEFTTWKKKAEFLDEILNCKPKDLFDFCKILSSIEKKQQFVENFIYCAQNTKSNDDVKKLEEFYTLVQKHIELILDYLKTV
jgi:hypothetical protein